jgi:hypothetical protein
MPPSPLNKRLVLLVVMWLCTATCAQPHTTSQPSEHDSIPMPHVAIDREQRVVDIDATVVLREGGWLELLACTPHTRTHESIFVIHAKPSHIHLAMVMLGLEPGTPMRWKLVGEEYVSSPAHGPAVAVTILTHHDGKSVETPANQLVLNKKTGEPLPDNQWLFTGSSFDDSHTPPRYRADVEGSVLSLVNFGDEVLARHTDRTNQNDQGALQPNTDLIPPVGTSVTIRLRPVDLPVETPDGRVTD